MKLLIKNLNTYVIINLVLQFGTQLKDTVFIISQGNESLPIIFNIYSKHWVHFCFSHEKLNADFQLPSQLQQNNREERTSEPF